MLRPLIILLLLLLLALPVYVLFFTKWFDNLMIRLKTGRRAESIDSAVATVHRTVRAAAVELAEEREAIDHALERVTAIPVVPDKTSPTTHPYLVRHTIDTDLYWSRSVGWTTRARADRFDAADKLTFPLPENGKWFRPAQKRPSPQNPQ